MLIDVKHLMDCLVTFCGGFVDTSSTALETDSPSWSGGIKVICSTPLHQAFRACFDTICLLEAGMLPLASTFASTLTLTPTSASAPAPAHHRLMVFLFLIIFVHVVLLARVGTSKCSTMAVRQSCNPLNGVIVHQPRVQS